MYLIFDFDGTLVDSLQESIEIFNALAESEKFVKINPDNINLIKDLSAKELIKKLNIPFYKLPFVLYKAKKRMNKKVLTLLPFANITDMLNHLHHSGCELGILTSNSEDNVRIWLQHNKLDHYFKFIYSESNLYGKHHALKKLMKKLNIKKQDAIYIGDETRDIEAAKNNDITSIAVTWGFNSEKLLSQFNPDHIARTPQDIIKVSHSLSS